MQKLFQKYCSRQNIVVDTAFERALLNGLFVVIPAYLEHDHLEITLNSLKGASREGVMVNVVILINAWEDDTAVHVDETMQLWHWLNEFANKDSHPDFVIIPLLATNLPRKHRGAGLPRKIAMDQVAAYCGMNHQYQTVMCCMDADSLVAPNYFQSVITYFSDLKHRACSIYFEHPLTGQEFPNQVYEGITLYEMHLRCYRILLQATGFPDAVHTVGSSMAVRVSDYVRVGGMVKNRAGEDFYFIQKLIQAGGYGQLQDTCIYPSPRPSHRVIFGTGATISKWHEEGESVYFTYNIQAFVDLKLLFSRVAQFYDVSEEEVQQRMLLLPGRVRSFLNEAGFVDEVLALSANCSSVKVFEKRFFELFNAFKVMKYLNYVHEYFLEKSDVVDCATRILALHKTDTSSLFEPADILVILRKVDREITYLELG
jgi:hypothetical protein